MKMQVKEFEYMKQNFQIIKRFQFENEVYFQLTFQIKQIIKNYFMYE